MSGRRERSAGVRRRLCCKGITQALWRQTAGGKKISLMCVMEYFWYPIFLFNYILIKLLLKYPLFHQPALFHSRKRKPAVHLYILDFSPVEKLDATRALENHRAEDSAGWSNSTCTVLYVRDHSPRAVLCLSLVKGEWHMPSVCKLALMKCCIAFWLKNKTEF